MDAFKILFACFLLLYLSACTNSNQEAHESFEYPIEKAHRVSEWNQKGIFKSDIKIIYKGQVSLEGKMYADATSNLARFELNNGGVAVFVGKKAWVAPHLDSLPRARFHLLTWPYFLKAPYKLDDPGTVLEPQNSLPLKERKLPAARLSFEEGVGDTPDDWYYVYRNPGNNRLAGMAYIITYGNSQEKAEQNPHAITYHQFEKMDGIPVSTFWRVWNWSKDQGITEEQPIETIELTNPEFIPMDSSLFEKPADAMESKLPGS